jgi:cell division protein ZapA (FtsZ GTPase activity inhibitor)
MVVNEWKNGIPSVFIAIGKSWRMICAPNSPSIIKTITNQLDAHVIIMDNAQAKINVLK